MGAVKEKETGGNATKRLQWQNRESAREKTKRRLTSGVVRYVRMTRFIVRDVRIVFLLTLLTKFVHNPLISQRPVDYRMILLDYEWCRGFKMCLLDAPIDF